MVAFRVVTIAGFSCWLCPQDRDYASTLFYFISRANLLNTLHSHLDVTYSSYFLSNLGMNIGTTIVVFHKKGDSRFYGFLVMRNFNNVLVDMKMTCVVISPSKYSKFTDFLLNSRCSKFFSAPLLS